MLVFTIFLALLHTAAAVFSTLRLTELFLYDRITEPIRKRIGHYYLFSCVRCMSVWCGGFAALLLWLFPWGNWPFALSGVVLLIYAVSTKRIKKVQSQLPVQTIYKGHTQMVDPAELLKRQMGELIFQNAVLQAQLQTLNEELQACKAQLPAPAPLPVPDLKRV